MDEKFSIDNLKPFFADTGGTPVKREYFQTRLTFPIVHKKEIMRYLRTHKKEIVQEIISAATEKKT